MRLNRASSVDSRASLSPGEHSGWSARGSSGSGSGSGIIAGEPWSGDADAGCADLRLMRCQLQHCHGCCCEVHSNG
jgi:hypothetical protein